MSAYPRLLGQVAEVGWARIQREPKDPTKTAIRHLRNFCDAFEITELPLSQKMTTVFLYLVWKIRQVSPETLSKYLTHIRAFYYDIGIGLPMVVGRGGQLQTHRPEVSLWLRGLRKKSTRRKEKSTRFVIDVNVVRRLIKATDRTTYMGRMLCFAWALAVMRSLREDDVAPFDHETRTCHDRKIIRCGDLSFKPSFESAHRLRLTKWWRKNRLYGTGTDLSYTVTDKTVCAVRLGREFLSAYPRGPEDVVFTHEDGTPMSTREFREYTMGALCGIGIDLTPYKGISFRKGGAQSGVQAGLTDEEIRLLGDWAPDSNEFARYRRRSAEELADLAAQVVRDVCED